MGTYTNGHEMISLTSDMVTWLFKQTNDVGLVSEIPYFAPVTWGWRL